MNLQDEIAVNTGALDHQLHPFTGQAADIGGNPISHQRWLYDNVKLARLLISQNPDSSFAWRLRRLLPRLVPQCRFSPRRISAPIRSFSRQRTPRRQNGTSSRGSPSSDGSGSDSDPEPPRTVISGSGAEPQRGAESRRGLNRAAMRTARRRRLSAALPLLLKRYFSLFAEITEGGPLDREGGREV